jgi:hypothetical protein
MSKMSVEAPARRVTRRTTPQSAGFGVVAMAIAAACSSGSAYGDCYRGGDECAAAFGLDL